jgi:hypothetical protein
MNQLVAEAEATLSLAFDFNQPTPKREQAANVGS